MVKKILSNSNFVSNIHKKLMKKITNPNLCNDGEKIITLWRFPNNKTPHAGQIHSTKILPNGNKQVRITTAYGGDASVISLDTRVFSPEGELLKAYHGIRGAEINFLTPEGELIKHLSPTRSYANDSKGVAKIIKQEQSFNPNIKFIQAFPKS